MSSAFTLTRRSFIVAPLALAACKGEANILELTGKTMGTTYSVTLVDRDRATTREKAQAAIDAVLAQVNAQMSNWDASSEITQVNAARHTDAMQVSPDLAEVLQAASDVHAASDGQFDIALGPVIDLWGFGAKPSAHAMPKEPEIVRARNSAGQDKLILSGTTLRKSDPEVEVYLSAIGKGHGVDRVARAIEALGVRDYMVEIGGDLYASGKNAMGMPWQIGIETPDAFDRSLHSVASVSQLGMATSGDYRNYFEQDGQRFSHIIDPQTGRPITHRTTSTTVLTENAILADAWATALLTLGRARGLEIATERDMAVLFIERAQRGEGYTATPSPRFAQMMG